MAGAVARDGERRVTSDTQGCRKARQTANQTDASYGERLPAMLLHFEARIASPFRRIRRKNTVPDTRLVQAMDQSPHTAGARTRPARCDGDCGPLTRADQALPQVVSIR